MSFPESDRLFAQIVHAQVEAVRSGSRTVRAVRRDLRASYPRSDLHRQREVLVDGAATEVWFAYRDGRRRASRAPDRWWEAPGVARAVVASSGRVVQADGLCRSLLGLPSDGRRLGSICDYLPSELAAELLRLRVWLAGEREVTSSTFLRPLWGRTVDIEFHIAWDGSGRGRHAVTLRTMADRDAASERRALDHSGLGSVTGTNRSDLMGSATRRELGAGERLPESIAGSPWAVLVVTGVVRLYVSADRLEPTILYGGPGSLLGTHWAPADRPLSMGLQTVTASSLLQLNASRIERLLRSDADFARAVMAEEQSHVHELVLSLAVRSVANLPQRLAREILLLADLQPDDALISVTEQQLADGVGSIRESIGRTIADFRRQAWLATTRHGIIIRDRDALRAVAIREPA
jgi:CRP-like cAMP-binding protein